MAAQAFSAAWVPVYEWLVDGECIGVGTASELAHWASAGIIPDGEVTLGTLVGTEPISVDQLRAEALDRAAA